MNLLELFSRTLDTTLPVFAMVFVGIGLKRLKWIDREFVSTASALVFKATLPTLIFLSLIKADLSVALDVPLLLFFAAATLGQFLISWLWASYRVPKADRGIYVQGAFRGNCGIVGLALAAGMYGNYGLSAGSLLLGVVIVMYNALSVVALAAYQPGQSTNWRSLLKHIVTNPLIISVVAALPFTAFSIPLPSWLITSGDYFASLTLPLALICVGATLSVATMRSGSQIALSASSMKMIVLPLLSTLAAWAVGFSGEKLGLLFLFFASPTAAASFVMVKAMNGNVALAANIVAMTTLMASVTVTTGIFALRLLGWI
ncbi:AEC family transporter [Vreelandella venusta]|uniref:AEC family transporter n=1 Tax=Vreelandella venusta TaxID=44935 RepID=A0AAP9ZBF5_9GAMM|nr:AEC family transporter [Halomonas venusta]MBR9925706.1 AEC family transporter [Gammaproteobacteria bacterium]AZM96585.1 AEC family transporter [Halomonas venusta]MDW0359779.1 AEC family transporter [Halomonas venusta]NPT30099.1 AEC family transporter [Halomonas venusta]QPI62875.1 AEC family transporter [Halomonas venusta]